MQIHPIIFLIFIIGLLYLLNKKNINNKFTIYNVYIILFAVFLCIILYKFSFTNKIEKYDNLNSNVVFIIPSTSRNMNYTDIQSCSLIKTLYESLKKLNISNYKFLIGSDDDDDFYNKNIPNLQNILPKNFYFHILNNFDKSYVCIVNQLANIAIKQYNAEYIYVFADDLIVYDLNFIKNDFIPYFNLNNNLCLGWGIDEGHINLCTHPFIHKKHVEYLGYFYPPSIKNWFCDNWIQKLYEKLNKIKKTANPVIKNVIVNTNVKRYDVVNISDETLNKLVENAFTVLQRIPRRAWIPTNPVSGST
jgi:hypothetical protein